MRWCLTVLSWCAGRPLGEIITPAAVPCIEGSFRGVSLLLQCALEDFSR